MGQRRQSSLVLRASIPYNTPDKEALVQDEVRLTYAQLEERVNRLATSLSGMGVEGGDRVAIMMRNCHQYLETRVGAHRASGRWRCRWGTA